MKRFYILSAVVFLGVMQLLSQAIAQEAYSPARHAQAVEKGLAYLAARQKENGSFGDGYYQGDAAITALAGMAFISSGDVCESPDSPASRCVKYLLSIARSDGFINRPADADSDGSFRPMYGHGFAALFLAETAGMYKDDDLLPVLDKAIALIIASQNDEGAWRYFPVKKDADVSVTACQVMALRAARNAGRDVPAETIDRAVKYLKSCQNSDGGFMYMRPTGDSALPRSAAVTACLFSAGLNSDPAVKRALDYLDKNAPAVLARSKNDRRLKADYPYYTLYYLTGAYRQRKDNGDFGREKLISALLETQNPDGGWSSEFSSDYATAMALIVLQIENNYLPIWQK